MMRYDLYAGPVGETKYVKSAEFLTLKEAEAEARRIAKEMYGDDGAWSVFPVREVYS